MSEKIKLDNKNKNVEDFVETYAPFGYYFFRCGCGVFATDYPFVAGCDKCGYIYAGNKEQIEIAKTKGKYMTILKPSEVSKETRSALIEQYEEEVNFFDPFNPEC